jgi:hypothetical protein
MDDVVRLLGPPSVQLLSTSGSRFVYDCNVYKGPACQDIELVFDQHNVLARVEIWVSQDGRSGTTSVPECLVTDGAQP